MAKIQIKSEDPTRFGGIFLIREQFNSNCHLQSTQPSVYVQIELLLMFRLQRYKKSDNLSGLQKKNKTEVNWRL